MASESENLTIQILQQIQATLADHSRRFENMQQQMDRRFELLQQQMEFRFDAVERKIGEGVDATTVALGKAELANVRHDSTQVQLAGVEIELRAVRARLKALEEKV